MFSTLLAAACGSEPDCEPSTSACTDGVTPSIGTSPIAVDAGVDLLFVIDNSGSMAEKQALLARSFTRVIDELDAAGLDYRVGMTTTDAGNPLCSASLTSPERGRLVLSSCRQRLDDFVYAEGEADVRELACNDVCRLSEAELAILPTTTALDPRARARPWLERIDGRSNLVDGTDIGEALACFGPQGINGCGFESPLESMLLSLDRADDLGTPEAGFVRRDAILAVVFVTDEADCSYTEDHAEIFDPLGNRVFWSDPQAAGASSAVCWNAGVTCTGDPSRYDACEPVNKDLDGNEGVPDSDAVLRPLSRYFERLDALLAADQRVVIGLIGGVDDHGEVHYADVGASDPAFQAEFGIGPGCTSQAGSRTWVRAVPPVRLEALVDRYTPANMHSICADDYGEALASITDRITAQLHPPCFLGCVADQDPSTAIVEPRCTVVERRGGAREVELPECARGHDGEPLLPSDDVHVCHALRTDAHALTSSTADDISRACIDRGYNLDVEIVRRAGHPASDGVELVASCELADDPARVCPGLDG